MTRYEKIFNKTFFLNGFLSIFINPAHAIRKRTFKCILKNRKYISGDVLDFGCGSKPYKEFFQYKSYIGLDVHVSGHSTKEKLIDVFYDGRIIPFKDNNFDSIFSSEVLEHVEDLDFCLDEIFRILRPDGFFIFTTPFAMEEHEAPYDFRRLTSFGVENILKKHRFSIIKIEKTNNFLEANFQLFIFYVAIFLPKNKTLRLLASLLVIAPLNIISLFVSSLLPKRYALFSTSLCVAQKS